MPTTYAHWRFGADCIKTMPADLQGIVNNHRDYFDIGVHGPDIFFYDLAHKDISAYGAKMHFTPARVFFENAKEVYKKIEDKQAALTYILGFLSHFTLDSTCHGYVDRKKEVSSISHNLVESQWDRHIMMLDGKHPNKVDRSESLKPNKENAKVIAQFFPFDEKIIFRTTKAHHDIINALNCKYQMKDRGLKKLLKTAGMNDFADLFLGFEDLPSCIDSNLRLDKLRVKAIKLYPKLLNNLMAYLNDEAKLDKYFEHDFEPWKDYKDIPILSGEEELTYKVK